MAINRLNSSSRPLIAVNTHLLPSLSVTSNPSTTSFPSAHPTTIFAFQPNPPTFLISVISGSPMRSSECPGFTSDSWDSFSSFAPSSASTSRETGRGGSDTAPILFFDASDPTEALTWSAPNAPSTLALTAPLTNPAIFLPGFFFSFFSLSPVPPPLEANVGESPLLLSRSYSAEVAVCSDS
ncbi:unnamed protein product [Somion occarium]|uniref:Uncharacterized protein n=1 Tax=Somion occarium TaxID=3059160 RepID=A0ABP1CEW6_9APHY